MSISRSCPSVPSELARLRYLVAAENPYERRLLAEILKSLGLPVLGASEQPWTVDDVWQRPDVIIWSWSEPRFEVLAGLMEVPKPPLLLLLVSEPSSIVVQRAAIMGVTSVIAKPYSVRSLVDHIHRAIKFRKRTDSAVLL